MPEFADISTRTISLTVISNKSFSYNGKEFIVLWLCHSPACAEPDFRFFVKALVETSGTASHGVNRADDNRAAQQRRAKQSLNFRIGNCRRQQLLNFLGLAERFERRDQVSDLVFRVVVGSNS